MYVYMHLGKHVWVYVYVCMYALMYVCTMTFIMQEPHSATCLSEYNTVVALTVYLLHACIYDMSEWSAGYTICTCLYVQMVYRGHPNYYLTQHITDSPIHLPDWLFIYLYTLWMYGSYRHYTTNAHYITLLIKIYLCRGFNPITDDWLIL